MLLQIPCINDDYPVCYSSSQLTKKANLKARNLNGDIFNALLENGNFISLNTIMIKKECFDVVGQLDENYKIFYEYELVLRLAQIYKFAYIEQDLQVCTSDKSYELLAYYEEYFDLLEKYANILDSLNMFNAFSDCILLQAKSDGIEEVVSEKINETKNLLGIKACENLTDKEVYKVSIVMSCLNNSKNVSAALSSIENQTMDMINIQVILVDQGSSDDTLNYLEVFEKKYPFTKSCQSAYTP